MGKVKTTFKAEVSRTYFRRVEEAILEGVAEALSQTLRYGEQVAKKHAPVRKVTKVGRGHGAITRELDAAEVAALPDFVKSSLDSQGRSLRTGKRLRTTIRRSAAGHDRPIIQTKSGKRGRTIASARDVIATKDIDWYGEGLTSNAYRLRHPGLEGFLNKEGKRALKTGVGVDIRRFAVMDEGGRMRYGTRATLGGRLKREITSEIDNAGARSGVFTGRLISPTEYAQYVEFPTSRTAAQPYMRPARDAMEKRLPREIETQLNRASQVIGGGR